MIQTYYEPHIFEGRMLPFIFFTRETSVLPAYHNWHSDIEFIYCISGEILISCENTTYKLKPGDLFVVNPYTSHALVINNHTKYQCLIVSEQFCKENGFFTNKLYFQEHLQDRELIESFQNIAQAYYIAYADRNVQTVYMQPFGTEAFPTDLVLNKSGIVDTAMIRYRVLGFLIALCSRYILDYQYVRDDSLAIQRAQEITLYIRKNLAKPITLDMISSDFGICKSHLSRDFKKVTNMTIVEYINFLRCKEAKKLIAAGDSISSAAREVGFNNMSYFTRTYKKYMGELPSNHLTI